MYCVVSVVDMTISGGKKRKNKYKVNEKTFDFVFIQSNLAVLWYHVLLTKKFLS